MYRTDAIHQLFELHGEEQTFSKGAYLYHKEEQAKGIYRIKNGRVKLCRGSKQYHRMITFHLLHPSDFFGLSDFFLNESIRRCDAVAVDKKVIVQFLSISKLEQNFLSRPEISFQIIQSMIEKANIIWEKYCQLRQNAIIKRVFNTLKTLAIENGTKTEDGIELKGLTHDELANYIGMTRQGVTTSLVELKKRDIIDYNRNFFLIKNDYHT